MEALRQTIRRLIQISNEELSQFLDGAVTKSFKRREALSYPGIVPDEIFFVEEGTIRVMITDREGTEHTIHFALDNQFIADYTNFMLRQPSAYTLQAVDAVQVVVLPRSSIEWGYTNLTQGDRLGRLIAEYYFIYQDTRVQNLYARTPKERYDAIEETFPGIHNRVPQQMIASYLGITPVHLSRLKKVDGSKI
ncbi:Crp/Fnr family transcriptional regulator [Fibrella aquatilis]|uniref:Crp/Fnr family transcriptional regulator n=1 Tax=Fibrella aquatilis TaxID=2817059 RepID=A0A939G6Q9_9BACT|nr:cyclic nucleotide-binding domain-containing protein [Fibrella aquatilis]MBO0932881.1 Crp/Fnr family transcriptional regulator [Fibrella aquatilis]